MVNSKTKWFVRGDLVGPTAKCVGDGEGKRITYKGEIGNTFGEIE